MLKIEILGLLLTVFSLISIALVRAPRSLHDAPRNLLICCAHSDDCVITGAEYAYGTVQRGLSVRIVYLTCSGPRPEADIARTRKEEALAAWSTIGIPESNFTFFNLSESPVIGPLHYSEHELIIAGCTLINLIISLPNGAAVIIPSEGETHVDHRSIRQLALRALLESGRRDLIVYETPEYNKFLSVFHGPHRAVRAVIRHFPGFNRLIKPYKGPANFIGGPSGSVFRDSPDRLALKRMLLKYFKSQNADRLASSFGHRTLYRRIPLHNSHARPEVCISAFGGCSAPSTLGLAAIILGLLFVGSYGLAESLVNHFEPEFPITALLLVTGSAVSGLYIIRSFIQRVALETSLFVWSTMLGLVLGALS